MAIRVAWLRTFIAVVEAGNITDAAAALGRTPSAVSMTLKQLEGHLGRPLFEGDRKSRPTALGAYVLEQARREVEHFARTIQSIESYARNEIGQIDVACVPSFATRLLPLVLKGFLARWPAIEVDIRDMDSEAVRRFVDQGRVDIGIASLPEASAGADAAPLLADRFGVICSSDHPLAALDRPLVWADLGGVPFIANGICALIRDPEFQPILARSTLMVRNTTSILALVASGVGVTLLPRLAVTDGAEGTRFLPLAYDQVIRRLHILLRPNATPTPAAEAFVDALRQTVLMASDDDGEGQRR